MQALLRLTLLGLFATFASGQDRLRVMVWNAWRGGNEVEGGPEKVLAVIRAEDPDVVLMQESYDIDGERPTLGRWVAGELGWSAHQGDSPHLCILARSEFAATFFHHAWHGVGARIEDDEEAERAASRTAALTLAATAAGPAPDDAANDDPDASARAPRAPPADAAPRLAAALAAAEAENAALRLRVLELTNALGGAPADEDAPANVGAGTAYFSARADLRARCAASASL